MEFAMNESDQLALAERFRMATATLDREAMREICTEDVSWTIAGSNYLSGENHGFDGVLKVARNAHDRNIQIEVDIVLHGQDGFVVLLRESGQHDGKHLDIRVAVVITVRDGKIARIKGYLSDVAMLDAYNGVASSTAV
jgi:ketosteroid isomerase-like protein